MKRDIIDELAELIWSYGNDIAGHSANRYDDLDPKERARFRADVVEAARRHPDDAAARAIIEAAADPDGRDDPEWGHLVDSDIRPGW